MEASMQLVWNHILPAMRDEPSLPEDKEANQQLTQRVAGLTLPVVEQSATDTVATAIDSRTYTFETNDFRAETVSFRFRDDACSVLFVEDGQTISVASGLSRWVTADNRKEGDTLLAIPGRTPMPTKIASYYYWKDRNTLVMMLKYVENVHHDVFTFSFADQRLTLTFDNSLSYQKSSPEERAPIGARLG